MTICATIVFLRGKGFFRQEWTKSDAGYRAVVLPQFAVGMLIARKITAVDNLHDAVFAVRRRPDPNAATAGRPGDVTRHRRTTAQRAHKSRPANVVALGVCEGFRGVIQNRIDKR
ncbi:hypothetical protein KRMM14A1259_36180 [Krasilnikovia sp. MM14-A1259]